MSQIFTLEPLILNVEAFGLNVECILG